MEPPLKPAPERIALPQITPEQQLHVDALRDALAAEVKLLQSLPDDGERAVWGQDLTLQRYLQAHGQCVVVITFIVVHVFVMVVVDVVIVIIVFIIAVIVVMIVVVTMVMTCCCLLLSWYVFSNSLLALFC